MPAPSNKTGRSQLNVWIKDEYSSYIKEYAKRKGFNIGHAVERLIITAITYQKKLDEQESKEKDSE